MRCSPWFVILCAACGGGGGGAQADARRYQDSAVQIDARPDAHPDAAIDAPPDAPPPLMTLIVGDQDNGVVMFDLTATGASTPTATISGAMTDLSNPYGIAVGNQEIIVASFNGPSVQYFARTATGNAAPVREILPTGFVIAKPAGPHYLAGTDQVIVCDESGGFAVFDRTATDGSAPVRHVSGATTGLRGCDGVLVDDVANEIYVLDGDSSTIAVFPLAADGDVAPTRTINGAATGLSYPSRGAIDLVHGELMIADEEVGVLVFAMTATGNTAPLRQLSKVNASTTLVDATDLAYYPLNDEIYVADRSAGQIAVFNRTDVDGTAPKRAITSTALSRPASLVLAP